MTTTNTVEAIFRWIFSYLICTVFLVSILFDILDARLNSAFYVSCLIRKFLQKWTFIYNLHMYMCLSWFENNLRISQNVMDFDVVPCNINFPLSILWCRRSMSSVKYTKDDVKNWILNAFGRQMFDVRNPSGLHCVLRTINSYHASCLMSQYRGHNINNALLLNFQFWTR